MKDILTYKGFMGTVHFSAEDKVFHGKIEGIDDLLEVYNLPGIIFPIMTASLAPVALGILLGL